MKHTSFTIAWSTLVLAAGWYYALVALPAATRAPPGSYGRWVMADLTPSWYATRAVLVQHRSPYCDEVTRDIQVSMYGRTIEGTRLSDEQRFAYPVFAVFPLFPMAWLSLAATQKLAFWIFIALNLLTTWLWTRVMEVRCNLLLLAVVLAAFPVNMAIVLRQPTVLYLFIMALFVYCTRSGHLWTAGIAGAFAMAKPQLAIAVITPVLFWAAADWRKRKSLVLGFLAATGALLISSALLVPGWIPQWYHAMAAYSRYGNVTPLFFASLSPGIAVIGVVVLVLLWHVRRSLEFTVALALAASPFVLPFQYYNLPLVLPSLLWIWANRSDLQQRVGSRLAYRCGELVYVAGMAALGLACLAPPLSSRPVFAVSVISFVLLGLVPGLVLSIHYPHLLRSLKLAAAFESSGETAVSRTGV